MSSGNDNPTRVYKPRKIFAHHAPGSRRCLGLKCGRWFASGGPGNRMCPACLARQRGVDLSRCEENQQKDSRS